MKRKLIELSNHIHNGIIYTNLSIRDIMEGVEEFLKLMDEESSALTECVREFMRDDPAEFTAYKNQNSATRAHYRETLQRHLECYRSNARWTLDMSTENMRDLEEVSATMSPSLVNEVALEVCTAFENSVFPERRFSYKNNILQLYFMERPSSLDFVNFDYKSSLAIETFAIVELDRCGQGIFTAVVKNLLERDNGIENVFLLNQSNKKFMGSLCADPRWVVMNQLAGSSTQNFYTTKKIFSDFSEQYESIQDYRADFEEMIEAAYK